MNSRKIVSYRKKIYKYFCLGIIKKYKRFLLRIAGGQPEVNIYIYVYTYIHLPHRNSKNEHAREHTQYNQQKNVKIHTLGAVMDGFRLLGEKEFRKVCCVELF